MPVTTTSGDNGNGDGGGESAHPEEIIHDLTGFQVDCLVVIRADGNPKGLRIMQVLNRRYPSEVGNSRLYHNLDALVDEGFVERGQKDGRTNEYTLTDTGEEVLDARAKWVQVEEGTDLGRRDDGDDR